MMYRILVFIPLLAVATRLHAQSILDIEPGWPRDSAMKVLKGKYGVADTLVITEENHDQVIRMAPVLLAGYEGYVALHSDSVGRVTSIVWSRMHENIYSATSEQWATFKDWERWSTPTEEDFQTMLKEIAPRFDPWPYRIKSSAELNDSTSPAARFSRGWGSNTSVVYFWYGTMYKAEELRYVRKEPPSFARTRQ